MSLGSYLGRWLVGDWPARCAATLGVAQYPTTLFCPRLAIPTTIRPPRDEARVSPTNSLSTPDDKPPFQLDSNLRSPAGGVLWPIRGVPREGWVVEDVELGGLGEWCMREEGRRSGWKVRDGETIKVGN